MDKTTLTVIISFTLFGICLILYGVLNFKRNYIGSIISCLAGLICAVGINLMAMVP